MVNPAGNVSILRRFEETSPLGSVSVEAYEKERINYSL